MPRNVETEKPLILGERFEIIAGRCMVEALYGREHPLAGRFYQAIDNAGDWHGCPPLILSGKEKALTLNALFVQAALLDRPNDYEKGLSTAAAHILGLYFALVTQPPQLTPQAITTGLINRDPTVAEPL